MFARCPELRIHIRSTAAAGAGALVVLLHRVPELEQPILYVAPVSGQLFTPMFSPVYVE